MPGIRAPGQWRISWAIAATPWAGHRVGELTIEKYPGFIEKEISRLASEVSRQLGILDLRVVHRVGSICPGQAIVLLAALAAHRNAGFDAVRLLMDYLKTDAPLFRGRSDLN